MSITWISHQKSSVFVGVERIPWCIQRGLVNVLIEHIPTNVVKTIISHPFVNGLYHLFMVTWGMVYYCLNHIIEDIISNTLSSDVQNPKRDKFIDLRCKHWTRNQPAGGCKSTEEVGIWPLPSGNQTWQGKILYKYRFSWEQLLQMDSCLLQCLITEG